MRVNVSLHEILSSTQTIFDQVKKNVLNGSMSLEKQNIHQDMFSISEK